MIEEILNQFKKKINSYSKVSESSIDLLLEGSSLIEVKKGDTIVDQGIVSRYFYFLSSGYMIAYFMNADGRSYNKNIFISNDFVGSTVSAILQRPSQFAIEAVSDCTLLKMPYQKFREKIFNTNELKNFYIHYLERNWVIEKEKREVCIVLQEASVRYRKLLAAHPDLEKYVALQHIASHLGITATQLSRIRRDLKKDF